MQIKTVSMFKMFAIGPGSEISMTDEMKTKKPSISVAINFCMCMRKPLLIIT